MSCSARSFLAFMLSKPTEKRTPKKIAGGNATFPIYNAPCGTSVFLRVNALVVLPPVAPFDPAVVPFPSLVSNPGVVGVYSIVFRRVQRLDLRRVPTGSGSGAGEGERDEYQASTGSPRCAIQERTILLRRQKQQP